MLSKAPVEDATAAAEVGVKSDLGVLCLILSMVIGLVPQVLMQDKINEIIAAENTEIVSAEDIAAAAEDAAADLLAEVKTELKETEEEAPEQE